MNLEDFKMSSVSERLASLMREKHISCRKLSDMTGITKSYVNNYANGLRSIPLDKLQLIANALDVSASWLIGWADNRDGSNDDEQPDKNIKPLESDFISAFSSLSHQNQVFALKMIQELLDTQAKTSDSRE